MKRNRIILIVTIALLVIAAVLILTNNSSTLKKSEVNFAIEDTAAVSKIFLVDKNNNSVLLEKENPGKWMLNGEFLAHQYKINGLLETMKELKVRTPVAKKARNSIMKRLSSTSKKVEIYQIKPRLKVFGMELWPREVLSRVYYVGGPTQDNRGTFMILEGADNPYILYIPSFRGFVAAVYSTKEDDWRDHTVFKTKMNEIKSVEVDFIEKPDESFIVLNKGLDDFKLISKSDGEEKAFDTLRMISYLTSFSDIRFEAVLSNSIEPEYIDSVSSSTPAHIITLIDKYGDTTKVKTFRKGGFSELYDEEEGIQLVPFDLDRLYAVINNERDFVLIQYFVFDKVLRTASYLQGMDTESTYPVN